MNFIRQLRKQKVKVEDCGYRIGWNQGIEEAIKIYKLTIKKYVKFSKTKLE